MVTGSERLSAERLARRRKFAVVVAVQCWLMKAQDELWPDVFLVFVVCICFNISILLDNANECLQMFVFDVSG